jgi:hypothetical protein
MKARFGQRGLCGHNSTPLVIPAKAGIQGDWHRASGSGYRLALV